MKLTGKTIAVVGAGQIGQAVVRSALQAGASVVAVDHSEQALTALQRQCDLLGELACEVGDITDRESIVDVLDAATRRFGPLGGAVNTAYPRNVNYGRQFLDVTYDDFCSNVSLHLGGYFLFMQQCVKYAIERKLKFSLVNLSSIYGVIAPRFEIYAGTQMTMPVEYAAIKSGLQHLTRYATAHAKGTGFRANCVSPGGIAAGQDPRFLEEYNQHCRSKGMLDALDVVPTILFLLADEAEYIAGQNIVVDDGFSL